MTQWYDVSPSSFAARIRGISSGGRLSQLLVARPVVIFILLSALFGLLTIALTPRLRGPDESPHFLRAYGLLVGDIVPSAADARGRKGVLLPAALQRDMELYEQALYSLYLHDDASFQGVLQTYALLRAEAAATSPASSPAVFVPYAGSEGYSPVPYLPYLPGLALARNLDFPSTLYLTRLSGFIVLTAVMAFAIALVPHLQWPFVLIGLLPSALFSRSVLGADAGALALAIMVTALALRGVHRLPTGGAWMRALWMSLCVLSKQPMLAFILLEAMRLRTHSPAKSGADPIRHVSWARAMRAPLAWRWRSAAIVMVPALALSVAWVAASSAEVAAWRLVEEGGPPLEHYQPLWKLGFLLDEPGHFPRLLVGTWHYLDDYARQLIGILGSLDMPLRPWVYPLLGAVLIAAFCAPFDLDPPSRRRLAVIAGLTALGYILAVFLIFYLVWTGLDQDQIEGVQGRYFVVVLPLVAVIFAALLKGGLSPPARAWTAVLGSVLAGCATLDAVLRADWTLALLPI
jgi:Predicted membrane protein (DUF2142)